MWIPHPVSPSRGLSSQVWEGVTQTLPNYRCQALGPGRVQLESLNRRTTLGRSGNDEGAHTSKALIIIPAMMVKLFDFPICLHQPLLTATIGLLRGREGCHCHLG